MRLAAAITSGKQRAGAYGSLIYIQRYVTLKAEDLNPALIGASGATTLALLHRLAVDRWLLSSIQYLSVPTHRPMPLIKTWCL